MSKTIEYAADTNAPAVERAVRIINYLTKWPEGVSAANISRDLQIPRASTHYLLKTLLKVDFVHLDRESRRYMIGMGLLPPAEIAKYLIRGRLREMAPEHLQKIVNQTSLTAHISTLDYGDLIYLEVIEPPNFERRDILNDVSKGRRLTPYRAASGMVQMTDLDLRILKMILRDHPIPRDSSARTLPLREQLRVLLAELEKTKKQGYAFDDQKIARGVRCVAAPIHSVGGRVVAAIGGTGLVSDLNGAQRDVCIKIVKEEAAALSKKLRYSAEEQMTAA